MNKSFYILITQDFAERLFGQESQISPGSHFGYAITIGGQYVCSINSANDFPEEFAELGELTVVALGIDSFPVTPPIE